MYYYFCVIITLKHYKLKICHVTGIIFSVILLISAISCEKNPKVVLFKQVSQSIFSNSGYVGWCTASPDKILKLDTLVMTQTKFGFHWSSTFRGEDF
jgi:hypothetical protein